MLKLKILTTLMAMFLFAGPAMAEDGKSKVSEQYHENVEENKEAKNMPHPAHEMGEGDVFNSPCSKLDKQSSLDTINKCQAYLNNLKQNRESKGMPHPAHEMGKGNVFDEKN